MKSLMCVVFGDGSKFVVDIEDHKRVAHLKNMIKEANEETIKCDAKDVTLYIAKKGSNWLKTGDPDVKMLENHEFPEGINDIMKKRENKMDPGYRIGNTAFDFPDEGNAGEDEIHVLVAVPGQLQMSLANDKEPHPIRKRRWEQLNEIVDNDKKAKTEDDESEDSKGDAYVSFKDINEIMPANQYEQSTKAIGDDTIDLLYSYLLVVMKAFGEVGTGAEAKRLHFIFPVLACVCALFDGDAQILAEEKVVGKRVHGDAKFQFVIKRGRKRLCIIAKDDMDQGLAQAYVGSEVLSDVVGLSTVCTVATNYKAWYFLRITDGRVERDGTTIKFNNSIPARKSVKEIAEKLYAMLAEDD